MRLKNKNTIALLFIVSCVFSGYWFWLSLHPVEIIAVHQEKNFSDVLVTNFPFTNKEKVSWWLKNRDMLKEKYNIPKPAPYGGFTITFWYFGDGYKEEGKYDRLCFRNMAIKENCIEKEKAFTVTHSFNRGTTFTMRDGVYRINENGNIIKID